MDIMIAKVIKKKSFKFYAKWKSYHNLFKMLIEKKTLYKSKSKRWLSTFVNCMNVLVRI